MLFLSLSRRNGWVSFVIALAAMAGTDADAIEMFTYFGDGSRIGLPSLEVPIEAYPGIPLRSDRLRARRRAVRMGPATTQGAPRGPSQTITIRAMPEAVPAPSARPTRAPAVSSKATPPTSEDIPVAPEPAAEALNAAEAIKAADEAIPSEP